MRSTNRAPDTVAKSTPTASRMPGASSPLGQARPAVPRKTERSVLSQRQMAETLVRSLGYDAAVEACFEHGWYGVLSVILAEERAC